MTRHFLLTTGLVALLIMGAVAGAGAAQETTDPAPNGTVDGTIDATAPATATTTPTPDAVDRAETVVGAAAPATDTPAAVAGSVGPVDILSYRLEGSTMTMTVESDEYTAFALSDALAGLRQEGVSEVPVKQGTLEPGRQTLTLTVTTQDGAGAVTLSTPGNAVRIQTEAISAGRERVPFGLAALLVLGAGVGSGYYSYRRTKDELTEDDEPQVTRIA